MFKNSPVFFAHLFFVVTGMLSASAVWAAVGVPPNLTGLPWPQIGLGIVLALWGGATRTAERALEARRSPPTEPPTIFVLKEELLKDVIVSSGIGFLVFLLGASLEWGVWVLPAALWLGGYLGSRLLAGMGEAALSYLKIKTQPKEPT